MKGRTASGVAKTELRGHLLSAKLFRTSFVSSSVNRLVLLTIANKNLWAGITIFLDVLVAPSFRDKGTTNLTSLNLPLINKELARS